MAGNMILPRRKDNTGLAMMVGAAQGLERGITNLYAIQETKQKLKQEQEMHGADLKIKQAQLDKFELLYGPEQVEAEREKLKAETNAANALFNLRTIQISREQQKNVQSVDTHTRAMALLDKVLQGGRIPAGMRVNSEGAFSVSGQKDEVDVSSLLGPQSGGMPEQPQAGKADWWNE